jgi:hypothetical protein
MDNRLTLVFLFKQTFAKMQAEGNMATAALFKTKV